MSRQDAAANSLAPPPLVKDTISSFSFQTGQTFKRTWDGWYQAVTHVRHRAERLFKTRGGGVALETDPYGMKQVRSPK